jgi:hypothetical protein
LIKQHGGKIVNRLIIAGIGVLAVALLATGCGGGGSAEATAQVSKAQFFKQARAICAKAQKKLQAQLAASKDVTTQADEIAHLRKVEAEELADLTGSETVEQEVKPFITALFKVSEMLAQEGRIQSDDPSLRTYAREAATLDLTGC